MLIASQTSTGLAFVYADIVRPTPEGITPFLASVDLTKSAARTTARYAIYTPPNPIYHKLNQDTITSIAINLSSVNGGLEYRPNSSPFHLCLSFKRFL